MKWSEAVSNTLSWSGCLCGVCCFFSKARKRAWLSAEAKFSRRAGRAMVDLHPHCQSGLLVFPMPFLSVVVQHIPSV